jgi:hypothetical protein
MPELKTPKGTKRFTYDKKGRAEYARALAAKDMLKKKKAKKA